MPRKVRPIINDILETIGRVERKVAGKTFRDFTSDWEMQFIVQRAVEIISEATRRLPDHVKATKPDIPWKNIAGIGSILRHDYHTVSDKIIWDVVIADLPALKAAIEDISASLDE